MFDSKVNTDLWQNLLPLPIPHLPSLVPTQPAHDARKPLGRIPGREELLGLHALPEVPAEVRLDRPRMGADAYSGYLLLLEVEIEGTDGLIERGLGGAVGEPPAQAVVGDGAHAGRHVDPLRELLPCGARAVAVGRGRREESGEVLHEEEVRDDVELESVLNRFPI